MILLFILYYHSSVRLFPFASRIYIGIFLKCGVNNLSFIRIHRLESYVLSGLSNLSRQPLRQLLQGFLSLGPVVFSVYYYLYILLAVFIYNQACKVLYGVKGLASFFLLRFPNPFHPFPDKRYPRRSWP